MKFQIGNVWVIIRSLYFNMKYFKFKEAIKLPILISNNVKLVKCKGSIEIKSPLKFKMIKIGFQDVDIFDKKRVKTIFKNEGKIVFMGRAEFWHGDRINVCGEFIVGNNVYVGAETTFVCNKKIKIGDDSIISWHNLIMDTDFHSVFNSENKRINYDKEVNIGKKVWLGCRSSVYKGSVIGDNVVVAASSIVHGKINGENMIVGGQPIRVIKENTSWSFKE